MVMVWLEGGQGEVSGACPPPPQELTTKALCQPPPPPQLAPPGPPPQGPLAHFYWGWGGSRVQKRGDGPPVQHAACCSSLKFQIAGVCNYTSLLSFHRFSSLSCLPRLFNASTYSYSRAFWLLMRELRGLRS